MLPPFLTNFTEVSAYLGLYNTEPPEAKEVSGGEYIRTRISLDNTELRQEQQVAYVRFPQAYSYWGPINGWGIFDGPEDDSKLIAYGSFGLPERHIVAGDTALIEVSSVLEELYAKFMSYPAGTKTQEYFALRRMFFNE